MPRRVGPNMQGDLPVLGPVLSLALVILALICAGILTIVFWR